MATTFLGVPTLVYFLLIPLYFAYGVAYNLLFHPLRKFPGPILARASRLYEVYFEIFKYPTSQYIFEIDRLHDVYGPIVRIAPDEVHVRDLEFYDVLYAYNSKRDRDAHHARLFSSPLSLFGSRLHDVHKRRRMAINPFMSRPSVMRLEPVFREKLAKMCDTFSNIGRQGGIVYVRHAMVAVTTDMITEHAFNKAAGALDTPDFSPYWAMMMGALSGAVPMARSFPYMVQVLEKLPVSLIKAMSPLMGAFFDYVNIIRGEVTSTMASLANTSEKPTGRSTVFQELLFSALPPEEKTHERLTQEGFGLIGAASETSQSALSGIIFHIVNTPGLVTRLKEELATVMERPDSFVEWPVLERLPLLTAVIKEGLRWRTTLSGRLPLCAYDDIIYANLTIPAGTTISMTCRDALYDPTIYPSPQTFDPDRWLRPMSDAQRRLMDKAYLPFNKGPRICVGMHFAYSLLFHVIASLFRRFDLELVDTLQERDVDLKMDHIVAQPMKGSKGVKLRVVRDLLDTERVREREGPEVGIEL